MSRPILITAGGTGGHVYPALAVADYLRARGIPLIWLGTRKGLEFRVVPERGYELLTISIGGLRGKGWMRQMLTPFRILAALAHSMVLLARVKPRVVLGMGGFAAGPAGVAAWLMRIPLLIHEQNAVAGFTNRILANLASRVLVAFPGSFPSRFKPIHTGNPLRAEIAALAGGAATGRSMAGGFKVLVLGGSQGAGPLNTLMPAAFASLEPDRVLIWHQSGERQYQETCRRYRERSIDARVVSFIDEISEAYRWADLVVCRSGALTVSEIAAAGSASILIPFPQAADDHQTANARYLSDKGAAILAPQAGTNAEGMAGMIRELMLAPERLSAMASRAARLAVLDATERVASQCLEMANA